MARNHFSAHPVSFVLARDAGMQRGLVEHIADGDTLDVLVDEGRNQAAYLKIRLFGTAAPESRGPTRLEGQRWRSVLESLVPVGTPVLVVTLINSAGTDVVTFDRWLGNVWLVDGTYVNQAVVALAAPAIRDLV